jgi:hypothetical protein
LKTENICNLKQLSVIAERCNNGRVTKRRMHARYT